MLILLFIYFGSHAAAMTYEMQNSHSELDQVREKFQQGMVLHAAMTHEFKDSYTGETEVTRGMIWISKNKYRIQADEQIVLVDGETSRVYNERQNKLVVSFYEPEEDDFAPSRFFSNVDDIFTVEDIIRDDDSVEFILRSDDPFEIFLEVSIRFDNHLNPLNITATDQMDNILVTTFTETEYLETDEDIFHLDYPEDAEIIDLRN